ncbi:MAG: hypothetical protein M3419_00835 [Actinomycetota bacterium]|nr:hypothetical protein [Actinomycetota bacterium]
MSRAGLRAGVNWVNGSTLLGLAIARVGHAHLHRDDQRRWHASGYRGPNDSRVFTIGNVILHRHGPDYLDRHAELLRHESAHCTQWAFLGPVFVPVYYLECTISWLLTGDPANGNALEAGAGLSRGGYRSPALQRLRPRRFTRGPW